MCLSHRSTAAAAGLLLRSGAGRVSKWNMLDTDSLRAKTVNGFKTKRERAKKISLFLD